MKWKCTRAFLYRSSLITLIKNTICTLIERLRHLWNLGPSLPIILFLLLFIHSLIRKENANWWEDWKKRLFNNIFKVFRPNLVKCLNKNAHLLTTLASLLLFLICFDDAVSSSVIILLPRSFVYILRIFSFTESVIYDKKLEGMKYQKKNNNQHQRGNKKNSRNYNERINLYIHGAKPTTG